MRKYYKILIALQILFLGLVFVPVNAAVGYNYSHDGRIIHSTVGLSVTNDGIYTVISEHWTNDKGDRVRSEQFTNPMDLYLYNDDDGEDVIYIVDASSNILYVFDGNMYFQHKVDKFEIRPEDFIDKEDILLKTRTRSGSGSDAQSITFDEYLENDK